MARRRLVALRAPFDLKKPFTERGFVQHFDRCWLQPERRRTGKHLLGAPPQALLQGVKGILRTFGAGSHRVNGARFVAYLGTPGRLQTLRGAINQGPGCSYRGSKATFTARCLKTDRAGALLRLWSPVSWAWPFLLCSIRTCDATAAYRPGWVCGVLLVCLRRLPKPEQTREAQRSSELCFRS